MIILMLTIVLMVLQDLNDYHHSRFKRLPSFTVPHSFNLALSRKGGLPYVFNQQVQHVSL